MNTAETYAALRERFAPPEWAIFFEVANGTGFTGRRYADAVAMGLYPSRGLEIHGIEVKASRNDWRNELKNPAKAEEIFKYCDRWWLVVGDKTIVQEGELPATWGLMVPKGNGLAISVQAQKLTPQPLDRPFFAALCRRASTGSNEEIEAIVRKRVNEQREKDKPYEKERMERAQEQLRALHSTVQAFETASGVKITNRWDCKPEQIGAALKFLVGGGLKSIDNTLDIMERHASDLATTIKAVRAAGNFPHAD